MIIYSYSLAAVSWPGLREIKVRLSPSQIDTRLLSKPEPRNRDHWQLVASGLSWHGPGSRVLQRQGQSPLAEMTRMSGTSRRRAQMNDSVGRSWISKAS